MTRSPSNPPQRWQNRPLVREPDPHRSRMVWRALLGLIVAFAPTGLFLLQQNECLTLTYAVEELRSEQEALREEERDLRVERAELESLTAIERWALDEGVLERPAPGEVVIISPAPVGPDELVATTSTAKDGS